MSSGFKNSFMEIVLTRKAQHDLYVEVARMNLKGLNIGELTLKNDHDVVFSIVRYGTKESDQILNDDEDINSPFIYGAYSVPTEKFLADDNSKNGGAFLKEKFLFIDKI